MMVLDRIPQGGRWPEMKAALQKITDATQSNTILPAFGTRIIQQTPAGTLIKAMPGEEQTTSGEPIWL